MNHQITHPAENLVDAMLISILIYNYRDELLVDLLEGIFNQQDLINFEVVICDDAGSDLAWDVAQRYAFLYDGRITISRNRVSLGKKTNREKAQQMCRGKFTIELTDAAKFVSCYAREILEKMVTDPYLEHSYISRLKQSNFFIPPRKTQEREIKTQAESQPLVTICIYNYNYGCYLRECLESAFSQTYKNIEICFSDNASTDESWELANEFSKANPGLMSLSRNRINFGPNIKEILQNLPRCLVGVSRPWHRLTA